MGGSERNPGNRGCTVPDQDRDRSHLTRHEAGPDPRPSPNIWHHPATYELENHAIDRDGQLAALVESLAPWADRDVLDLGCGTGFHLPLFAATARTVTGVEPHPPLAAIARRRIRRFANTRVLDGSAEALPLVASSVDVMHARFAYFFGSGCEAGLAELDRVMRPGGRAVVIDNDAGASTFGEWFRRGFPDVRPRAVEHFWSDQGWERHPLRIDWTFDTRADFEAVARIELPVKIADHLLAANPGITGMDYALNVWCREF